MRLEDLFESYMPKLEFLIKTMKPQTKDFNMVVDGNGKSFEGSITFDRKPQEVKFKIWKGLDLEDTIKSLLLTYGFEAKVKIEETDDWYDIDVTRIKRNKLAIEAKKSSEKIAGVYFDKIISKGTRLKVIFSHPNLNGNMHRDDRGEWFSTVKKEISKYIPEKYIEFETRM
jgi:hypothetical protein